MNFEPGLYELRSAVWVSPTVGEPATDILYPTRIVLVLGQTDPYGTVSGERRDFILLSDRVWFVPYVSVYSSPFVPFGPKNR